MTDEESVGTSLHPFLELIATLDSDDRKRGTQFEKLCKWLLENHPFYKSKLKQVWLWDDWPERWGKDCGIDIVAEDINGLNWAIQAKCYDPKYSVTKKDIDSFLSESTNTRIHRRLLIATTDGIGSNAEAVIERQREIVPINKLMLSSLLEAPIKWPKRFEDLSNATIKKAFTPHPHQQTAIDAVTDNLMSRGQLIMACGTGKTLTGLWIAEKLEAEITLVLLPSLLLLSKTLTEWLIHSKEPFSYLPVCSDDTVNKSEDAIALSTSDLSFPSTTDANEIATFIANPGRKVIFSTYQSSGKIAEALKNSISSPLDLVIADEAHRCAGKANSDYAIVLDNDKIPASKRLFMTATPRIYQSQFKKKASDSGVEILSMDDETVFGPTLHTLTFGEAIQRNLLTDYQVMLVGIDNATYASMITERTLIQTDTGIESDAQSFASHIALAKAVKNYNLKRIISFHSRVNYARDFANELPRVIDWMPNENRPDGALLTSYVSGKMPTQERNKNLQALSNIEEGQRYVLSNAQCLSEGVDIPALDGVAFIDPKNSMIDIIQAVGRAIRKSSAKTIGTIVIPVFIENHEDPDEVLNSSPWKKVWNVLNALRSHDEVLAEQLDQLRRKIGKRGTVGKPDKFTDDLPKSISHEFETALRIKLIEATTASWEFYFGLLQAYQLRNGHLDVPQDEYFQGHPLGSWVSRQRAPQTILSQERKQQLNDIGFIWDARSYRWDKGFELFLEFKEREGHPYMPKNNWVLLNRREKKKGNLDPAREVRLNEAGFVWEFRNQKWEEVFLALSKFVKTYGHPNVTWDYGDVELISGTKINLATWCEKQRGFYQRGALAAERIKKLNSIDFDWTRRKVSKKRVKKVDNSEIFERITIIKRYTKKFGHCVIKQQEKFEGYPVGMWVGTFREKYFSNHPTMTADIIHAFEGIHNTWLWSAADTREGIAYPKADNEALALLNARKDHEINRVIKFGFYAGLRIFDSAHFQIKQHHGVRCFYLPKRAGYNERYIPVHKNIAELNKANKSTSSLGNMYRRLAVIKNQNDQQQQFFSLHLTFREKLKTLGLDIHIINGLSGYNPRLDWSKENIVLIKNVIDQIEYKEVK